MSGPMPRQNRTGKTYGESGVRIEVIAEHWLDRSTRSDRAEVLFRWLTGAIEAQGAVGLTVAGASGRLLCSIHQVITVAHAVSYRRIETNAASWQQDAAYFFGHPVFRPEESCTDGSLAPWANVT